MHTQRGCRRQVKYPRAIRQLFCFILNSILINGAKIADSKGIPIPVYLSGNVDGGREHNVVLEDKYLGRVKHL